MWRTVASVISVSLTTVKCSLCTVSYRLIDLTSHVRAEKFLSHCVLHASVTWVSGHLWIALCMEIKLPERYRHCFLYAGVDVPCLS